MQSASVTVHPLFPGSWFTMSGLFIFTEASSSLIPQTQTKKNKGEGQREGREGDQGAKEGGVGVGFAEFGLCLVWK